MGDLIWLRSRNCGCLVTWFSYQLIAKPGNKTAAVSWPHPYSYTPAVDNGVSLTNNYHEWLLIWRRWGHARDHFVHLYARSEDNRSKWRHNMCLRDVTIPQSFSVCVMNEAIYGHEFIINISEQKRAHFCSERCSMYGTWVWLCTSNSCENNGTGTVIQHVGN